MIKSPEIKVNPDVLKTLRKENKKDRESMAMLKILAMGRKDMLEGKHKPVHQAFGELKKKIHSAGKLSIAEKFNLKINLEKELKENDT